jgi:serine/threonine protein kinase
MSEPEPTNRRSEKEIFFDAIEKATPEERAAYVDGACGKDPVLRRRVEDLLAKHFQQDTFMKQPAVEGSPTIVLPPSEGPGTVIDRYKLLEKLGEGGFGVVYVAEQKEPVRRRIALKIIKLGMDTKHVIARFEAERQALALMDHPNIAKVLDAGATETGRPYFVMELVRGVPIAKYCDENKLPTIERLKLFIAVCHAIQHAHQKGIIHRDIKPSNILVTLHDGVPVPKVIDFGIARATQGELTDKTVYTQFQQFIGTPAYISPEQAEMSGLDIDTRSDIYSLGVLLYELLTGKTPLDAETLLRSGLDEMRRMIREKEPLPPSTRLSGFTQAELTAVAARSSADGPKLIHTLRGDLDWIVMKCLEKDRTRRYDTASGLAADLKRYLNNEPVVARPPSSAYRFQKFVRRHKRAVAATGAIALALVLGLGLATFAFLREREARLNQAAAEKEKRAETVRADAVGEFMGKLLTSTAVELLRQGHQRPVRDLLAAADQLASTALSNAPAAEFHVRGHMARLYFSDGPSLLDPDASYEQVKRVLALLPVVPGGKLQIPRDEYRIRAAAMQLWAGHTERGLNELHALKDEFQNRRPPADISTSLCLALEGNWHLWKGEMATAEAKLTEALRMVAPASLPTRVGSPPPMILAEPVRTTPADVPRQYTSYIRVYLAIALADRKALAEAEKVAREGLLPVEKVTPGWAPGHVAMVSLVASLLCHQKRFAEAESLLRQQQHDLSAHGIPPRDLLALEKKLGDVFARAGKAQAALAILMSVATNSLSTPPDCADAACVALGSGDLETYRRLCAEGLTRFTGGAEGINALALCEILLAAPQDEVLIRVASDLVRRVEESRDFSKDLLAGTREWLEFRKGNVAEAAALLPKVSTAQLTAPIAALVSKSDYLAAILGFRSAIVLGRLGRFEEAREAYARGVKGLGQAPSPEQPRDLGDGYDRWYLAEAHRREAEEVFRAKGIAFRDGKAPTE